MGTIAFREPGQARPRGSGRATSGVTGVPKAAAWAIVILSAVLAFAGCASAPPGVELPTGTPPAVGEVLNSGGLDKAQTEAFIREAMASLEKELTETKQEAARIPGRLTLSRLCVYLGGGGGGLTAAISGLVSVLSTDERAPRIVAASGGLLAVVGVLVPSVLDIGEGKLNSRLDRLTRHQHELMRAIAQLRLFLVDLALPVIPSEKVQEMRLTYVDIMARLEASRP